MTDPPADRAQAASAADGAFGAALYRLLATSGGNLVFSPACIAAALRMALCGARGQTATEIAAALRLQGHEADAAGLPEHEADAAGPRLSGPQAAADGLRQLSAGLADLPQDGVVFRAPNTMWVQAGMPLQPEFTAVLREAAAVSVRDADFRRAAEAARLEINDLIEKQTEGKITDLLAPGVVDGDTRLVLVNAIYLKAAWAHPFPEQATSDAPFYPEGPGTGTPVTTAMMRLDKDLRYLRGDGYQAVVLPYAGPRLAMTIVLPDGPLDPLPAELASGLSGLPGRASRHRVSLTLPRFRQEAEFDLVSVLQQLGISQAFDAETADFTGITTAERLSISEVVHKAFINVDEQGTEAAAATAITMSRSVAHIPAPPVTMIVDHPFLFTITDTTTGLPLFLGQVTDPSSR
jgi:serpin B